MGSQPATRQATALFVALLLLCMSFSIGQAAEGQAADAHHGHHMIPEPTATESPELRRIPDVSLIDQEGAEVRFYSDLVADKVVAINFIFTSCTTVCPPMGAIFGKLHEELGERAGRDVHLLSVSVDPVTDTPERLKAWSQRFGSGPGWTLVTGGKHDVDKLLKSLEVFTPDFADHSPTVLVGNDSTGNWKRAYGLAAPAQIAELIDEVSATTDKERRQ